MIGKSVTNVLHPNEIVIKDSQALTKSERRNYPLKDNLKIGLALGSGSSRGWSHIGIIKELASLGVTPDIVCGTSVGAMVGAAYLTDNIDKLEDWALSVTKFDVAKFLNINASMTGFLDSERFHTFLNENIAMDTINIEDLQKPFAAVSTDLESGREIWLKKGPLIQAVCASMSMPGLFPAIRRDKTWLVDGGLVNPVPVSVCRSLGADIVIAVNLNGDIVGKHFRKKMEKEAEMKASQKVIDDAEEASDGRAQSSLGGKFTDLVREYANFSFLDSSDKEQPPSLLNAIAASINITQDRITRSRIAGDPPDIIFSPRLSDIGLLELHRGDEAILEGRRCVQRHLSEVEYIFGL
ncbi:MAG: patatin-like phospholipase family protein [Pseudomonadales bacterium]|nr:patatin-like phospholipase family protein [Pseudomonadales bacterium]MDG1442833.1 patatin-like phospholipase family protein [Pseudomonadales bacterium]